MGNSCLNNSRVNQISHQEMKINTNWKSSTAKETYSKKHTPSIYAFESHLNPQTKAYFFDGKLIKIINFKKIIIKIIKSNIFVETDLGRLRFHLNSGEGMLVSNDYNLRRLFSKSLSELEFHKFKKEYLDEEQRKLDLLALIY